MKKIDPKTPLPSGEKMIEEPKEKGESWIPSKDPIYVMEGKLLDQWDRD